MQIGTNVQVRVAIGLEEEELVVAKSSFLFSLGEIQEIFRQPAGGSVWSAWPGAA